MNELSDGVTPPPLYSLVIPAHDEAGNVVPLLDEIHATLADTVSYEVIFVDDASRDATVAQLTPRIDGHQVRLVRHSQRCGKSAAIKNGVRVARGSWIVVMDADGQNDPADIPVLIAAAGAANADIANGVRRRRQDTLSKRWASRFANRLRRALLDDGCPDTASGLKLFRRDAFLELPFFSTMHRFFPALFQMHGYRATYPMINDRPRRFGQSKYSNLGRALVGIVDLVGVSWLKHRTPARGTVTEATPGPVGVNART